MQMAKPRQARNKVVANALAFCRQEQLRNCFSFREKKKEREKKIISLLFSFFILPFIFFQHDRCLAAPSPAKWACVAEKLHSLSK